MLKRAADLVLSLLAVVLFAAAVGGTGCASWQAECSGDPTGLPCTCPGQQNPGCYPPLTDARRPDGGTR